MTNDKHLRQFVIGRFIWTLLGIVLAEEVMLLFVKRVLLPICAKLGIFSGDLKIMSLLNDIIYTHEDIRGSIIITIVVIVFLAIPIAVGSLLYTSAVAREIKKTEDEFIRTQRENDRQRYLMISDIAHDLKTPMTTVSGYAQALSDGLVKDSEKQKYLDAIKIKTERMNEMINMLFDYTKLNSEGFTVSTEKLDLAEFLREIAASAYTDIEEAGDELDVDIPEETLEADIDRVQMTRVINNLLTNAVRHNAAGTRINVTLRQDGEDLIIFIADSGDMIPEKLAEGLFQPFVMGDESRQTKGGTGLGLSIAKKIVELHGATIKLSQKPEVARCHLGEEYNKAFVIHIQAA